VRGGGWWRGGGGRWAEAGSAQALRTSAAVPAATSAARLAHRVGPSSRPEPLFSLALARSHADARAQAQSQREPRPWVRVPLLPSGARASAGIAEQPPRADMCM
jgi:hypothetical protein